MSAYIIARMEDASVGAIDFGGHGGVLFPPFLVRDLEARGSGELSAPRFYRACGEPSNSLLG